MIRYSYFKICTLLFCVLILCACTSVFSDVRSTWQYATEKHPDAFKSPEDIKNFPYSAQYVQREGFPRALLVLGYIDGEGGGAKFSWISSDHETLVTQQGRLIKTDNLEQDLLGRTNLSADPLRCIQAEFAAVNRFPDSEKCFQPWSSVLDFQQGKHYHSVPVHSEFSLGEQEVLELPSGHRVAVRKVNEYIQVSASSVKPAHQYTNEYWLETDGHIVKSKQYFAPGEPAFYFTQVKWVGRDYE